MRGVGGYPLGESFLCVHHSSFCIRFSILLIEDLKMPNISGLPHPSRRRGFSAVEIIAVATVIAILALILIPMLRDRVELSREKAALDEMSNLGGKVADLAYAAHSHYFRLQDLDNTNNYSGPNDDAATCAPFAYYTADGSLQVLNDVERRRLSKEWLGPYTQFRNSITIRDLKVSYPFTISDPAGGSPIIVLGASEESDLYPVDPWGNPYLFFPRVGTIPGVETNYQGRPVLVSTGPNGAPGDLPAAAGANDYIAGTGAICTGDDIIWKM